MLQELTSNLRPAGRVGEGKGKLIPGRGHSICKHLKVRMHTACSCNEVCPFHGMRSQRVTGKVMNREVRSEQIIKGIKEPRF